MDLIFENLKQNKLFKFGLLLKGLFVIFYTPEIQNLWFIPFVNNFILNFPQSPWDSFLLISDLTEAFPYGPIMLLSHLPTTYFGSLLDVFFETDYYTGIGFRTSLLLADLFLLFIFIKQFSEQTHKIIMFYWLSPIAFFITYIYGQTDIIPLLFLFISIYLLRKQKIFHSAIYLSFCFASKHIMILAIPFIFIYCYTQRNSIRDLIYLLCIFLISILLLEGKFYFEPGFHKMVIENRETLKFFSSKVSFLNSYDLFVLPIIYSVIIFYISTIKRISYELLFASLGVAFGLLVIFTPAPASWYLWIVPFIVFYSFESSRNRYLFLVIALNIAYLSRNSIFNFSSKVSDYVSINSLFEPLYQFIDFVFLDSLLSSLIGAIVLIFVFQFFIDGIKGNDYFHLAKKPVLIGVFGNDTNLNKLILKSFKKLLGYKNFLSINLSSYQLWDKTSPMYKSENELDEKSVNIPILRNDIKDLLAYKSISLRKFNREKGLYLPANILKSNQFIVLESASSFRDLAIDNIFDISFHIQKTSKVNFEDINIKESYQENTKLDIFLEDFSSKEVNILIKFNKDFYYRNLFRELIGLSGVRLENIKNMILLQGELDRDDSRIIANRLIPNLSEFINYEGNFSGGNKGILQLITLLNLNELISSRKLNI